MMDNGKTICMPGLSGSVLKVIALCSMTVDHMAYYLMDENTLAYEAVRCVGRIAFPVFALLVAEGFSHTRNRWRYLLSLLLFAVISEVPWVLLGGANGTHNVMFTLCIGVASLTLLERLKGHRLLAFFVVSLLAAVACLTGVDYGWRGILMITFFYMFRRSSFCMGRYNYPAILQILFTFPLMSHYGIAGAVIACWVILLYDGSRGFVHGKAAKYAFYAFYPLHLWLFYGCC